MTIADWEPGFQWFMDHWKIWGIPGLVAGGAATVRVIYQWALFRFYQMQQRMSAEIRENRKVGTSFYVPDAQVIERMSWPGWIVRAARRWERRKTFSV